MQQARVKLTTLVIVTEIFAFFGQKCLPNDANFGLKHLTTQISRNITTQKFERRCKGVVLDR